MTAPFDIKAAIAATVATAPVDMSVASKGGDYVPPAAGSCQLRLVSYLEVGQLEDEWQGVKKYPFEVQVTFELSGKNHEPKKLDDGTLLPHRITLYLSASKHGYQGQLSEKSGLYKLFRRLNWKGTATHMADLVGEAFLGRVVHKTSETAKKVRAYLQDDDGFTITPPRFVNPVDDTITLVEVAKPVSPLRVFLWNAPEQFLKPMWDSLFIDGTWEAEGDKPARSKNVIQERIKSAINFKGSPIHSLLEAGGVTMNLGNEQATPAPAAAGSTAPASTTSPSDPLANIS